MAEFRNFAQRRLNIAVEFHGGPIQAQQSPTLQLLFVFPALVLLAQLLTMVLLDPGGAWTARRGALL